MNTTELNKNEPIYQEFKRHVFSICDISLPETMPKIGREVLIPRPTPQAYDKQYSQLVFVYFGGCDGVIKDSKSGYGNETYFFKEQACFAATETPETQREKAHGIRKHEVIEVASALYDGAIVLKPDNPVLSKWGFEWSQPSMEKWFEDYAPPGALLGDLKTVNDAIIQGFWAVPEGGCNPIEFKAYRLFNLDGTIEEPSSDYVCPCYHVHQTSWGSNINVITAGYQNALSLKKDMPNFNIIEVFSIDMLLSSSVKRLALPGREGLNLIYALTHDQAEIYNQEKPERDNTTILIIGGEHG